MGRDPPSRMASFHITLSSPVSVPHHHLFPGLDNSLLTYCQAPCPLSPTLSSSLPQSSALTNHPWLPTAPRVKSWLLTPAPRTPVSEPLGPSSCPLPSQPCAPPKGPLPLTLLPGLARPPFNLCTAPLFRTLLRCHFLPPPAWTVATSLSVGPEQPVVCHLWQHLVEGDLYSASSLRILPQTALALLGSEACTEQ